MNKFLLMIALMMAPAFAVAKPSFYEIVHACVEQATGYTEFGVYAQNTKPGNKKVFDAYVEAIVKKNDPRMTGAIRALADLAWTNRDKEVHVVANKVFDMCMNEMTRPDGTST